MLISVLSTKSILMHALFDLCIDIFFPQRRRLNNLGPRTRGFRDLPVGSPLVSTGSFTPLMCIEVEEQLEELPVGDWRPANWTRSFLLIAEMKRRAFVAVEMTASRRVRRDLVREVIVTNSTTRRRWRHRK